MKTLSFRLWRMGVQAGFALFCLYVGYRFYRYYLWATGASGTFSPRPPAVEGFLPISALLGVKHLVLTGKYDPIHPAGLTIFLAALTLALFLRKGFCGWICPVGFLSNLVEKAGAKIRFVRHLPRWLDYPLLSFKYVLLGFFSTIILWQMSLADVEAFMTSTYNKVVDGKMLMFFLAPSARTLQILLCLFLLSLVLRNFWCRYLCPYGALLGLLSMLSPVRVSRDVSRCIHCEQCDRLCPGSIKISEKKNVWNPECIGCGECVATCPQKDCLNLSVGKGWQIGLPYFAAAVVGLFFLFWATAMVTGHWVTSISPEEAKVLYPLASRLSHP